MHQERLDVRVALPAVEQTAKLWVGGATPAHQRVTDRPTVRPGDQVGHAPRSLIAEAPNVRLRVLRWERLLDVGQVFSREGPNVDVNHRTECGSHLALNASSTCDDDCRIQRRLTRPAVARYRRVEPPIVPPDA